jgi:hypothetical protein
MKDFVLDGFVVAECEEDRSSALYVSREHLDEAVKAKQAWDDFWKAATHLATVNREEMKRRWQAAGKARRANDRTSLSAAHDL